MCSIEAPPTASVGARLAELVEQFGEIGAEVAAMLADPAIPAEIAALPADSLAGFVASLAATVSAGTASLTVLTGAVDAASGRSAGTLIAGTYVSTSRFLQVEAGMSKRTAAATIARARDLRGDYAVVAEPWLSGRVSSDAVRELTVGVQAAMRASRLPAGERDVARTAALEILLPVAETGTVQDVARVVGRLRLLTDEDGATQAALEAYDEQRVTVEQVGSMSRVTAWLTHEVAAAAMTVLELKVGTMRREGDLAAEEQVPNDVDPATWDGRRRAGHRHAHLLAVAFGHTFTGLLDDNRVGSHHGIAPHVTLSVDVARLEAGLGADLTMPGSDEPVLLPNETVRRILCDCDITTVVVRPFGHSSGHRGSAADALLEASREVLYVGRAERVVPPRLRRALEARDRHCRFPGCRAHARRCHAHHVREWENGGGTDLDNCLLLCVRHHHAVHEGGWVVSRVIGVPPGADGCWDVVPPERRRRP